MHGRASKPVPFGAFVRVGDEVSVVVNDLDRERRRLSLSRRQVAPGLR
ncbi:S1 RNA-binding domain-containing protein [Streptomyces sp. NPDC057686]